MSRKLIWLLAGLLLLCGCSYVTTLVVTHEDFIKLEIKDAS